jgi:hypothetical protein
MSRVAIVGSCITRDLWRLRGEATAELLYISRTSLPSVFAAPVAGLKVAAKPPGGLAPQPHRALIADLQKTALATLVAFRPTHLIFDFIDERYDLLSIDGALATHSWELETSGYRRQPGLRDARVVPRLSAAAERLWLESAAQFAAFVRATPLGDAALILHRAQWADRRRTASGRVEPISQVEILPGRPADLAQHNAMLRRYEAAFVELMPAMATIAAPEERFADDSHQWGPSPFHYAPEYYAAIASQLAALDLDLRAA